MLSVASCKIGKDYVKPETGLPGTFRDAVALTDTLTLPDSKSFFRNKVLLELIDTALAKNNDLKVALANISSAQLTLKRVRLNYLPELTAQVNGSHNISSKNSLAGIGNEQFTGSRDIEDYTASLGFSWEIDIFGRIKREKEEALALMLQNIEVKKTVQTRLIADVANAYYNLIMLDEQLHIANQSFALSDSTYKLLQVQYEVGETTSLGLQQAEAQLEMTRQLIPQIEQSIALQENALSLLTGTFAGQVKRTEQPGAEFRKEDHHGYPVSLLAFRPDIKAAEYSLKAANARAGIAQATLYPTLTITANGGLNAFKSSNWFSIPGSLFGNVMGGITQPVFQRKRLKTQYQQAVIEREKEVFNFRQAVLTGYSEVSDALISKEKLDLQMKAALNRERALEAGIKSAGILFSTGMVNYLEIINANNNYLQSRLQTAQLQRDQAAVRIALYRALGGGWN